MASPALGMAGNRVQDGLIASFRTGLSGNEILAAALDHRAPRGEGSSTMLPTRSAITAMAPAPRSASGTIRQRTRGAQLRPDGLVVEAPTPARGLNGTGRRSSSGWRRTPFSTGLRSVGWTAARPNFI